MSSNTYYENNDSRTDHAPYGSSPYDQRNQMHQTQGYQQQQTSGHSDQYGSDQRAYGQEGQHQYGPDGQPIASGDRGLGTDLLGAGIGAFVGSKMGGHGILGTVIGGVAAHMLSGQKKNNAQGSGGFFGRRDLDPNAADQPYAQGQYLGQSHQQSWSDSFGPPAPEYGQTPYPPPHQYQQVEYEQNQTGQAYDRPYGTNM